jgi:pimeloyl-ACP methyl ester carboxylesterase
LSYLERNPSGARGTLVFLHAFPLNADMWAPQLDAIPRFWRLIAPDFRGFGESDTDGGGSESARLTLEDYARDVVGLLEELAVRNPVLAGLSLGGYVAFAAMRLQTIQPSGLILADTRPQADTEEGLAGRQRMIGLVDREGAAGVANEMLPKLVSDETRQNQPDVVERVRRLILAAPPDAIKAALYRMMARPDSSAQLAQVLCPTLILVGERDLLTPPNLSYDMQARLTDATLETIPSAGHISNLEQPEAFNGALIRFLDRV